MPAKLSAQARAVVYVIPIEGMIDMGLAPFGRRILDQAESENAPQAVDEKAVSYVEERHRLLIQWA